MNSFNRQPQHALQFKPVGNQLKTGVFAQTVKRTVAPPVYRPQPVPKVLQTKSRQPVAPQFHNRVTKQAVQPKATAQPQWSRASRPATRPEQKTIAQPKIVTPSRRPFPKAPPVYRPQLARQDQTVQPMLIGGLALGAMAIYGGYRYFRRQQRESAISSIRQEQETQNGLINYVEHRGRVGETSFARAVDPSVARGQRQYDVSVNLTDPIGTGTTSRSLVESARIHERTHVSADQAYTQNSPGVDMQIFHQGHGLYHSYPIHDRAERLLQVIGTDNALTRTQRDHLHDRIKENSVKPIEWDSTINELLVYTRYEGIRANSNSVKLLVQYANENLQHRRGHLDRLPRLTTRDDDRFHQNYDGWPLVMTRNN